MNRDTEVLGIYQLDIETSEKLRLLEDVALDIYNEMEAEDQNMHPDIYDKAAEGLRLAKNFIRELREQNATTE